MGPQGKGPARDKTYCGAEYGDLYCTRFTDHTRNHIAQDEQGDTLHVWPQED